jgi:hypothetical protein
MRNKMRIGRNKKRTANSKYHYTPKRSIYDLRVSETERGGNEIY